jgi:hypothetical protein
MIIISSMTWGIIAVAGYYHVESAFGLRIGGFWLISLLVSLYWLFGIRR